MPFINNKYYNKCVIWYNQGTHIRLNGIHILCDPTFTTDEHPEWEEYQSMRKKAAMNNDYSDVDLIVVSHGHADHCDRLGYFSETHITVLAHPMTMDLKGSLFADFPNSKEMRDGDKFEFEGIKIYAHDSGHCGGSLMFLFEIDDIRILFTGDLNTQVTSSTYPARPIPCDILIMEATFGDPKYKFPSRDQINMEIYQFLHDNFKEKDVVLMFGQALGKVQEIVKLIRGFRDQDIKILLDGYSYICTQSYERNYGEIKEKINHFGKDIHEGKKQAYIQINDAFDPTRKTLVLSHMAKDALLEDIPSLFRKFGLIDPPIVLLSGLSDDILRDVLDMYNPIVYKISNHADYESLVRFAKRCQAEKVCVFHGKAKTFKKEAEKELNVPIYYLHGERCEF